MDMNGYVEDQFDVDMLEEGLFDNIEDIMDFSNDDNVFLGEVESCFHDPPPPPPPAAAEAATPTFPCSSEDVESGLTATSEENGLCDELNIPEDWLNLLDDTNFTLDLPPTVSIAIPNNDCIIKNDSLFRSSSPVSVLEQSILNGNVVDGSESGSGSGSGSGSSSSSSNSINNEIDIVSLPPISPPGPTIPSIPARARTKRHRPATFARRVNVTIPPLPPSLDSLPALPEEIGNIAMKKKKKIKKCPPFFGSDEGIAVRKCVHCGIQKTPQWRAGPTGPKTLCNACGVRYKSGRLFPEYRPAASPTFVASVHSNSHKKVVEMRIRASREDADAIMPKASPALKNCDLVAYIRRKD